MIRYLMFFLFSLFSASLAAHDTPLISRQGMMDLKPWRLDIHPAIELEGQWLVYPGQLLTLDDLSLQPIPNSQPFPISPLGCDISTLDRALASHRAFSPDSDKSNPQTRELGELSSQAQSTRVRPSTPMSNCVATYVLELRNLPTQPLAIMIPELSTAFRLIWNHEVLAQGGKVSDQLQSFEPYVGHRLVGLQSDTGRGVLLLQVSNLTGAKGPVRQLVLGEASAMKARFAQEELLQALSAAIAGIGCLLLMLQQRARRRYEKGLWGLALFSFATLLYTVTEGYTVINWFAHSIEWADVIRFNVASQNLFLPGLVFWLLGSYPGVFPSWYLILTRLQLLLLVPVILLLPEPLLIALESPQMLMNLALGCVGFAYMLRYRRWLWWSCREPATGVGSSEPNDSRARCLKMNALLVTLLFVLVTAVHDVLLYQRLLMGMDWLPLGFVCFIVSQIFLLAVQRARQHAYVDGINQKISANQQQLEKEASLCTQALKEKTDQLEETLSELHYLERHDGLTGLLRQSSFLAESRRLLAEQAGAPESVSLILLDLDRYKQIGAYYGPVAADQGMKEIAALLSHWAEGSRLCARLEGESFALLIPGMEEYEALQEAEWLRLRISQRSVMLDDMADSGEEFHITASFGVCAYPTAEADIRTMMNAAEQALNRAKAGGRNGAIGYSQLSLGLSGHRSG